MKARERRWRAAGASLLLLMTMRCTGTTVGQPQPAEFVNPVLGLLNKGIIQLDVNIDRATKRLEELKQFPDTQDMDAFRQKRLDLERKRLTVEAQLIERSLK